MIAFGRSYISTPNLVDRFQNGLYSDGAKDCVGHPANEKSEAAAVSA